MNAKKIFKNTVILSFLFGLGCDKNLENLVIEQHQNNSLTKIFYTKTLSLEEIPEITDFFESLTKKDVFTQKGEDLPVFDIENIIEVLDTLKNRNYSFSFTFEDTPKTVLYNLIIGVDSVGQKSTPVVLKFTSSDQSYDQWAESGFDFSKFNGTFAQYRYTDFFENGIFSKSDCPEHLPNGDPSPCYESDISNGSLGTGSGGASSSGGGTGGGKSGGCTYNSYFHACGGSNQYTTHGSQGCGGDGGGSYWVLEVNCPNGNNSTNYLKTSGKVDCEDCESGPSGGIGANTISLVPNLIEDKIESSQLDPCSSQILNQLKNLNQNDIAKIMQRFGAPKSSYNWELITTQPSVAGNVAETDRRNGSIPFDYVTKIDPNYKNQATKISIARTILHEMLHTYMISHIDDVNAGNTVDIRNFIQLWQYIMKTTSPGGSTQPAQHEYMAQRFIPHLRDALKEWDGAKQPDQFYEDLAWGALFNTGTFNHFHPIGSSSRLRIMNRNAAEDNNSNSNGTTPKSIKC